MLCVITTCNEKVSYAYFFHLFSKRNEEQKKASHQVDRQELFGYSLMKKIMITILLTNLNWFKAVQSNRNKLK